MGTKSTVDGVSPLAGVSDDEPLEMCSKQTNTSPVVIHFR